MTVTRRQRWNFGGDRLPALVITKGGEEYRTYVLRDDVVTIGRSGLSPSDSPDIELQDKTKVISRYHAAVAMDAQGSYFVRDLGSANGTFLNGDLVYHKVLNGSDRIDIGEYCLVYDEEAVAQTEEPMLSLVDEKRHGLPDYQETEITRRNKTGELEESIRHDLHDITLHLRGIRDAHERATRFLKLTVQAFSAKRGVLASLTPDGALEPKTTVGLREAGIEQFEMSRACVEAATTTSKPATSFLRNASVLCGPLTQKGRAVGVVYIERAADDAFSDQDVQAMAAFCEQLQGRLVRALASSKVHLDRSPKSTSNRWHARVVGNSDSMRELRDELRTYAASEVSVLLLGETGTGKEVCARAVHDWSNRHAGLFEPLELSALSPERIEAELFGWLKGAFTGSSFDSEGVFERADGGTLFLDEIGDVGLDIQAKLRRAVEQKEINRLGANRVTKVDVRLISATNVDRDKAVNDEAFRLDLLQRLGKRITLPPLRERKEDIPLLVGFFIDGLDSPLRNVSHGAMRLLLRYDWPGNVRELKELIHELSVLGHPVAFSWDLPDRITKGPGASAGTLIRTMKDIEKDEIIKVLTYTGWNKTQAARLLGYSSKQTLYNKIEEFGIKPPQE
jgi:transcriptional regulator with GAF, ATPase, and Fis domain